MSFLFSPDDIRGALRELASELRAAGVPARIHVVGGAAVALHVGREALTRDIDALHPHSAPFAAIVELIAERRRWPANWLNDAVKAFSSHYDTEDDWEVFEQGDGVIVLIARPQLLLAMKLLAGRGTRDREDIERLLDACSVVSVARADEIFERYYPDEVMNRRTRTLLATYFDDGHQRS